jgi:D-alanyl-D-alanine carboxypeptidase
MKLRTRIFALALIIFIGAGIWHGLGKKSEDTKSVLGAHQTQTFDKNHFSIDDPQSIWIIVNKKRSLNPVSYAPPDLTSIGNAQFLRHSAADAFEKMVSDAKNAGYILTPESGYRSYDMQTVAYNHEVSVYGSAYADTESARPGYSEHQTGWAVDIESEDCQEDCFGKTPAAQWLLDNSYKYGFIHRYPTGKSDITGYRNEPWHFRFVGEDLAAQVNKSGQVLEEFFGLPAAPTY